MEATQTAVTTRAALKQLKDNAEQIANDGEHRPTMEVGDSWRQGDVIIMRLPDDFVAAHKGDLTEIVIDSGETLQLAEGSTQGSRHCLASLDGITVYRLRDANALDGPVIHATRPFDVTHPEHGNVCDLPAGDYAFPGQRTFTGGRAVRRTKD